MVAIAIDFFEKVDKFLNEDLTTRQIIVEYYLNFIPWINGLLWPLFAFLAVIFFTSRMASNSEIVAILSAGVSYKRILVPYLIAGSLIASVLWVGKNYVIPYSNKIKNEFESEYIKKSNRRALTDNIHFFISPEEKVYIRYFRKSDSTAQNFMLERFEGDDLVSVMKVRKLVFKEHPNVWTMHDIEHRSFDGLKEQLYFEDKPRDTTLAITPEDFIRYEKQMEMMSSEALRSFIDQEEKRGIDTALKFKTELYQRTSDPFTIIILTILGVTIASRKVRGGLGLHLAFGIILGAGFIILSKFSMTFSTNLGFNPLIGAWMPNIIFGLVTFVMFLRAQK